ncbi:GNAT family N-acetyltransferase [Bifidobacterium sp.]|jgi:GNAT superfamily N-acetyltransferase|uniref:GNAT family N-acetyltransferase n=1 Tax=Bifidobacterium sp. TaxID=41200 RepID=UPI0025C53D22|nr:GNAT family N-acetyltransferase [Bifidobacterium sp.]MCH4208818.1 GNAT family N-acetyltransferase [Bifidobacterium sp.]MCI1224776.1 GNAT family N-acetyltransferase [Bifidobacterium sp.]
MTQTSTQPATVQRWDDVETVLCGGGDGRSCQCQWPVVGAPTWRTTNAAQRADLLHHELLGPLAPGVLAYIDGQPAGWVRVGPRPMQQRLGRSRIVRQGSAEPIDAPDVWAVTCFSIRREYRHRGLGAVLLDAAIEHARSHGARVLEAYPIDTAVSSASSNALFVGVLSTFLRSGFQIVARPTPSRAVVALEL